MNVRGVIKWVKSVKHVPDRIRHASRRQSAIERLTNGSWHGQVLFICHGNVCRSPFAEFLFDLRMRAAGASNFTAASAGFVGPDRSSPPEALAAAKRLGVNLVSHRSKLITAELVHESSLIVVMSTEQDEMVRASYPRAADRILVLGDLDPEPIASRTIQDPWKGTAEVFDESYARIERCLRALMACAPVAKRATAPASQLPMTKLS